MKTFRLFTRCRSDAGGLYANHWPSLYADGGRQPSGCLTQISASPAATSTTAPVVFVAVARSALSCRAEANHTSSVTTMCWLARIKRLPAKTCRSRD